MKRNLLAIMLTGALLIPGSAQADTASFNADLARTSQKIAQCLYTKRRSDVVAALGASDPGQFDRYFTSLRNAPACQNITLNTDKVEGLAVDTPPAILRGLLAEAALGGMKLDALQPQPVAASYRRDWFVATGRDGVADEMAVCAAEQNPAGVKAVMATALESAEERSTMQTLSATLGPCLPAGATLKANRQGLRAALADALYHRATASALASK